MKQPTIKWGSWVFTPRLMSSLATLLLFPLFVYLGFWQLHRGAEKNRLEVARVTRSNQKPLSLHSLRESLLPPHTLEQIRYRTLTVTGFFLNEQTRLLDNQSLKKNGQPHPEIGYQVITPFQPLGSQKLLLVNRGWIPVGKSREILPVISPIHGQITLSGIINQPSNGLVLGKKQTANGWPLRIQTIDYTAIAFQLKQEIYPLLLVLKPQDPYGFEALPVFFKLSATRHLAYAVQWFMMSLAILIYYGVIHCRRVR